MNNIVYHQSVDELRKKYDDELAKERKRFDVREDRLRGEKAAIEKQQAEYQDKLEKGIRMYNSIKCIAGSAVQNVALLELPPDDG